ncbi:hypothetical protein [Ectothiorhodospira shaposhnikovii]|uniref:hypothetical protein n=1 Tax=Ectothiorhodospira shaposhnikovii TaxID=1054 RepID=UPI0019070FDB|nr:hypothetical protein [Ectothiorhodospira shaposhnikovii]
MDLTDSAIKLLVFLLPGFIALKIVSFKCDVKTEDYKYYVVEALVLSTLIYMLAGFAFLKIDISLPINILTAFLLAILVGIGVGEVKNKELLKYVFHGKSSSLSTHDKIYSIKAHKKLEGKWHVVGLKNGKEICGIIREFNTENNEMLIEKGRWVTKEGKLATDFGWIYFPPNQELEYLRSIEKGD